MYNMDQFNLLDLDNDVLDIIGDYVKKDNDERDFQKYLMEEIGKNSIKLFKIIKKSIWNDNKPAMRHFIINFFYVNNIRDIETIDIYLTLMKLNLKRKKYTFSTYCIENLEDSIKIYDEVLENNTLLFNIGPIIGNVIECELFITRFFH